MRAVTLTSRGALLAAYLLPSLWAAPFSHRLAIRQSEDSKSKDKEGSKAEGDDSSYQRFTKYEVGGVPLYILLLLFTGAMLLILASVYVLRRKKKEQKMQEEARQREAEEQAEVERRTGGMPIPEDEFEEDIADGSVYDPEKQGDPNFLQVQR